MSTYHVIATRLSLLPSPYYGNLPLLPSNTCKISVMRPAKEGGFSDVIGDIYWMQDLATNTAIMKEMAPG